MLGGNHAIFQPPGLKRLILMSAPASMKLWMDAQAHWRSLLPHDVQEILNKHEADGTTNDEEYTDAVEVFYKKHFCRLESTPKDILECRRLVAMDDTVYQTM
jgi:hypothetical protein